jgi:uncharacterized OB-fold protein
VISECRRCTHRWYLPHDRCPNCGTTEHRRWPSTGIGTAAAVTVTRAPSGGGHPDVPFGICLVDLDEGVRVMGRAALTTQVGDRFTSPGSATNPFLSRPIPSSERNAQVGTPGSTL